MKALILAAGLGSRLLDYTTDRPKALVAVGGKAIIDYQIDALLENGIRDINIVLGHMGNKIVQHVKKHEKSGCHFTYRINKDYENSNSSYSFWFGRDLVKNISYIHLNCDILFSAKTLRKLIQSKYNDVIVLDNKIELKDNMEQVRLDGNKIIEMRNTFLPGASGKAIGVAKFSPITTSWLSHRIEKYIKAGDKNQNFYGIIREAVQYLDIRSIPAEHPIFEVNSVKDLEKAQRGFAHG